MSTRGFPIEVLLYYSQIKIAFSQNIYCFLIHFKTFFKIIKSRLQKSFIQSYFKNTQSTQGKCCKIKITCSLTNIQTCNLFIKWYSTLHLNIFVPNVLNKRNLSEIQDKYLISHFYSREGEFFRNCIQVNKQNFK